MRAKLITSLQQSSFWLAAILHLLFFLLLSYVWIQKKVVPDDAGLYIPSYAYHESSKTSVEQPVVPKNQPEKEVPKKQIPTSENGIEKPVVKPRQVQFNQVIDISSKKSSEPVHLIGDDKNTPKPLIIILGKALTAKLLYPKAAIDLTIRGVSVMSFVLYPDGRVSDVRLLKSSGADILDQAALSAARQISPVRNVSSYVTEPMPIVFGIIFGGRN